jgi:hypothetical protein
MSGITNSENSCNPDYQPSKTITDSLALLDTRKTRSRVKRNRRSKSLNEYRSFTNSKNILEQSTRLVGNTENILDITSHLLDECKNILDTTNPPLSLEENQENQSYLLSQNTQQNPEQRADHSIFSKEKKISWSIKDIVRKDNPSTS